MYSLATTTPRLPPYPHPANLLRKERLNIGQQRLYTQLFLPTFLGFIATPDPSSERVEEFGQQRSESKHHCPPVLNFHSHSPMTKCHHFTRALRSNCTWPPSHNLPLTKKNKSTLDQTAPVNAEEHSEWCSEPAVVVHFPMPLHLAFFSCLPSAMANYLALPTYFTDRGR